MQALLVFCLVAVIGACVADLGPFTDAQLDFFKKLKFEELPLELRQAIRKHSRSGGDASNWCCINDVPIKSIQRSKVSLENIKVQTKVKVGYTKCSFLGTMMCATYDVRYTTEQKYHIAYYEVPDQSECKEADIKCCEGHVEIAGNCLDLETAKHYTGTLVDLKNSGLLDLVG